MQSLHNQSSTWIPINFLQFSSLLFVPQGHRQIGRKSSGENIQLQHKRWAAAADPPGGSSCFSLPVLVAIRWLVLTELWRFYLSGGGVAIQQSSALAVSPSSQVYTCLPNPPHHPTPHSIIISLHPSVFGSFSFRHLGFLLFSKKPTVPARRSWDSWVATTNCRGISPLLSLVP